MVIGFVGLPREGKTYLMVKRILERKQKEKDVSINANFAIVVDDFNRYRRLSDVYDVRNGIIAVDEINLVCPSRWWKDFPPELGYYWSQSGKFGLDFYWTSQSIQRVDTYIRELTNYVWKIDKVFQGLTIGKFHMPALCRARCYVPEELGKVKAKCLETMWYKIVPDVYEHFDTHAPIDISFGDYRKVEQKKQ